MGWEQSPQQGTAETGEGLDTVGLLLLQNSSKKEEDFSRVRA